MDRETKVFKTASGTEVSIKTYLTYGEARDVQSVYLKDIKVGINDQGKPSLDNVSADIAFQAQNKLIEVLVVSINGVKENILQTFLDLHKTDGEEIMKELEAVQAEVGSEEKKTELKSK